LRSASVLIAIVDRATALSSSMFDAGGSRSRWDLIDAQIASALSRYSLSELPLEWRGVSRAHHFRTCTGIKRLNLNGRIVDFR